ncbi:MAG: flagellar hook-length control protein FliK [Gemmatimonadota bacterium]
MNALDVLVAPRALATAQGAEEAAPGSDADATAGAFIALLNAMLGAKPLIEAKPATLLPTSLVEGEHSADGPTAEGEGSTDSAAADGQTTLSVSGSALVTDGELVGIARAALESGKRGATHGKAAAHSKGSRLLATIPLVKSGRGEAAKATPAEPAATRQGGSADESSQVPSLAAQDPSTVDAGATNPGAVAAAAAAAIVIEALTSTANTEAPRAAAPAPVPMPLPPATSPSPAAAAPGTVGESALVQAVTELLEGLTAPATPAIDPALVDIPVHAADASPTAAKASAAVLPAGVVVTALDVAVEQPAVTTPIRGESSRRETADQAESATGSDIGTTAPSRAATPVVATLATAAGASPSREASTRTPLAARPLHDPAPVASTTDRSSDEMVTGAIAPEAQAGEHESSSSEHGNAQRERAARHTPAAERSVSWSSSAGVVNTASADDSTTVTKEVAGTRLPDEAPKTAQPTSHVTLQLDKETLGASRIRVAVRGDTVRATILAEDGKAAALTAQLPELRRALEERGFTQARVTIQVEGQQEHQGNVIAGAMTDDLRAKPAASARADQGRDEQQPRGGRRQDPDGDRPRDRRRQAPDEETE